MSSLFGVGSRLSQACFVLLVLASQTSSASAWFKVCNLTDKTIQYEHDIYSASCGSSNPWRRAGWYQMTPGQCKTVDNGSMLNRFFYYYAESLDKQYIWTSDSWTWDVEKAAHNACVGSMLGCTTGGHGPCPGYRTINHREESGNGVDFTLNLF